jgi:hypothetical protein
LADEQAPFAEEEALARNEDGPLKIRKTTT